MHPVKSGDFSLYCQNLSGRYGIPDTADASLIYAPESGISIIGNEESLNDLRSGTGNSDKLRAILHPARPEEDEAIEKHIEFLPTMACNFRCSYCYAAKAHTFKKLESQQYTKAIDWLIRGEDKAETQYRISFVGGGEPLLEWEDIVRCMDYAQKKAAALSRQVKFSIITNGSLLHAEKIQELKKHHVAVRVSFEILKEVQQLQRGEYEKVAANIVAACRAGVKIGIRSIITDCNVSKQADMVQTVLDLFPGVRHLDFEPVCTDAYTPAESVQFYQQFSDNFFQAYDLARQNGISLDCIMLRMAKGRGRFFCLNDVCVSPTGIISACHRCVAPQEEGFNEFVYGSIEANGNLHINYEKDAIIRKKKEAATYDECRKCFARYNCAGGCLYQRVILNSEQFSGICSATRDFLISYLIRQQNEAYRQQCGKALKDFFHEQL